MSEDREQQPTRKKDRTQRMTGLLIVGVVIMAAVSLLAGLNKKLFGPEPASFQETAAVVKMEVETPVPDEAGDASRPEDSAAAPAADPDALNTPVPSEAVAEVEIVAEAPVPEAASKTPAAESASSRPLNLPPEAVSAADTKPLPKKVSAPATTSATPSVQPAASKSQQREAAHSPKKYIGRVTGLDFNSDFSTFTMSIKADKPIDQVTWFPVKKPRKVAVDLRGAWRPGIKPLYRFDEGVVEKVIVGEHPDRLRIVLWLRTPEGKKIGEPEIVKTPGGVNVTISD